MNNKNNNEILKKKPNMLLDSQDSGGYSVDPMYKELTKLIQRHDWDKSEIFIQNLMEKYPTESRLKSLQDDIDLQRMLNEFNDLRIKKERIQYSWSLSAMVIILMIIGVIVFKFITDIKTINEEQQQQAVVVNNQAQDMSTMALVEQAQTLIDANNLVLAQDVISALEAIDQNHPKLALLYSALYERIQLNEQYNEANSMLAENKLAGALELFLEVQETEPKFMDVSQKINSIEKQLELTDLLIDAEAAYNQSDWNTVIGKYETAILLNPAILDEVMKTRLVNSYIESIVDLLHQDESSLEDIQRAERYYKSAIALIPQSKDFQTERNDLDTLILNLIILKYSQYANTQIIENPFSMNDITSAVKYQNTAYRLNSENTTTKNDLDKSQIYLEALKDFYDQDWTSAISTLEVLLMLDNQYAGGKVNVLYYETLISQGLQRASYGLFADARTFFEKAEFIAWNNDENRLQLFEVQTLIAFTYGKTHQYQEAVSYYQYAFQANDLDKIFSGNPELEQMYQLAVSFAEQSLYLESYDKYDAIMEYPIDYFSSIVFEVNKGESLLTLADQYSSTIQMITKRNQFPNRLVVAVNDQELIIPQLP